MGLLRLSRESGRTDRYRDYRVVLDGIEIGRISDGQAESFKIAPGQHTLVLKIDWCRSNRLVVDIAASETWTVSCGSSIQGDRAILAVFYVFFAWHKYLWLKAQ